jgi:N6-L-threonylcarbamoyladenine synthase
VSVSAAATPMIPRDDEPGARRRSSPPRVLAIESSCDETAAAVVEGSHVLASVVRSQVAIHAQASAVSCPELASRHHLTAAVPVLRRGARASAKVELAELDGLAVTEGPGLVGALLVGVQLARLASRSQPGCPLYGRPPHGGAPVVGRSSAMRSGQRDRLRAASGAARCPAGTASWSTWSRGSGAIAVLGSTRDDAAGEAFDKVAKLLGLGYPGGPVIDALAAEGDPRGDSLPRAMLADRDASSSRSPGSRRRCACTWIVTASPARARHSRISARRSRRRWSRCWSPRPGSALRQTGRDRLHIVGGVAANRGLRQAAEQAAADPRLRVRGGAAALLRGQCRHDRRGRGRAARGRLHRRGLECSRAGPSTSPCRTSRARCEAYT